MKEELIPALTFDSKEDGWETSQGFIVRQIPMPVLDEKNNPEDAVSVILKMKYAGFCGSDRGLWYRNSFKDLVHDSLNRQGKTIRILGHEFAGEVIETGSMVGMLFGIQSGIVVSGDSHITCGTCYQCKIGESHVCTNEKILGISTDGVFAPYVKLPAKNLWPVDVNNVRPEIAAIYDPLGNAIHATSKVDVKGQQVAVFGCGAIGLFSILFLRNFGAAKIIAVDVDAKNLAMAKELGAHHTILIPKTEKTNVYDCDREVVAEIKKITKGQGVDVAMEMAGPNSSLNNAIESTRRGGHVILFGLKDGDFVLPKFSAAIVKGLTLHGIIGRRIFENWQVLDRVLADQSNSMQEKIWNIILQQGNDTIINFSDFTKDSFEKAMQEYPKVIFKF